MFESRWVRHSGWLQPLLNVGPTHLRTVLLSDACAQVAVSPPFRLVTAVAECRTHAPSHITDFLRVCSGRGVSTIQAYVSCLRMDGIIPQSLGGGWVSGGFIHHVQVAASVGERVVDEQTGGNSVDRVSPALLGLIMLAGAGLLGMVAGGSLAIHAYGMDSQNKEVAVEGFKVGGSNLTYEQYDAFIEEMREENYYLIAGGLGGLAALGMFASSLLFLNRTRPAAEVGVLANCLAILQAMWASSIGVRLGDPVDPGIGDTYFLMGVSHSLVAGCCLFFTASMILTSAGRASLRKWGEAEMEAPPVQLKQPGDSAVEDE